MKTLEEKIAVMQAAARGETIEVGSLRETSPLRWVCVPKPGFNWEDCDYRIARKPADLWVVVDKNGSIIVCDDKRDAKDAAERYNKCQALSCRPYRAVLMREVKS